MRVELDFKPYPKYKPNKSGRTICITNSYVIVLYDYSKKYDAFNAQDFNSEEFAMECQTNDFIEGFCEINDEQFVEWINELRKEKKDDDLTTEQ